MPSSATESVTTHTSAGIFRRFAALIYDFFLLFGVIAIPLLLFAMTKPQNGPPTPLAPKPIIYLYVAAVICGFYWYFWRKNGQTLGMQTWRLRLDDDAGGRPTLRQCAIRSAIGLLSLLCGGLGYWWAWWDREHLTWHDRASNTRVVTLAKR